MEDEPAAKNARSDIGGPTSGPPVSTHAPLFTCEGGEERHSGGEREGSGGGPSAEDTSQSAPEDPGGSGTAAASPDSPHIGSSPLLETKVRKVMVEISEEIKQLKEKVEEILPLSAEIKQLKEKVEEILPLSAEIKQLKEKVEEMLPLSAEIKQLKEKAEEMLPLSEENKQLKNQVSHLEQQNNMREREINSLKQELKKAQEKTSRIPGFRGKNILTKDFYVQVKIAGKTGGCEEKFLKEVKERLSQHAVSLKVKTFTEASKDLLLIFCPIASRMGTDIENALKGVTDVQKAILVVMHYVQKDNTTGTLVDAGQKVAHSALVWTVHTRYTLQDGLYPCEMNKAAVNKVAAAIQALAEDPPKPCSSIISSPEEDAVAI